MLLMSILKIRVNLTFRDNSIKSWLNKFLSKIFALFGITDYLKYS